MIGIDDAGALDGSGSQGVVGEGVDVAHQAAGSGEEGLDGRVGEQGSIDAGEAKAVLEIEAGGIPVEAGQGVADADALGEGLEVSQA